MFCMSPLTRFAAGLARVLTAPAAPALAASAVVSRPAPTWALPAGPAPVDQSRALSLIAVFRAVELHQIAAEQLPIDVERGGTRIAPPSLIAQPSTSMDRDAFVRHAVASLSLDGSAFWLKHRMPSTGEVVDLTPLDPAEVYVSVDRRTNGLDERRYHYRGTEYGPDRIQQLDRNTIPGHPRGLGPIEAARVSLGGALDARDYGSSWFRGSGIPDGILSTDQVLSPDQARAYKNMWYGVAADGSRIDPNEDVTKRVRVLGQGLSYAPLMIKPADAQFIESQQWSTTEIARLFGVPPSLLAASIEGGGQTYSNIEQQWIEYTRFGAMAALRPIETALSAILPRGHTARFRLDALARADRKTRYEGHKIGLDAGFVTLNEVRILEGLEPMPGGDTLRPRTQTPQPQETAA